MNVYFCSYQNLNVPAVNIRITGYRLFYNMVFDKFKISVK